MTGTPTVYLNGVLLSDIESLEALLEAVKAAGATLLHDAWSGPSGSHD